MSSDHEEDDLNYGIDDEDAKSFGKLRDDDEDETKKNLDFSNVETEDDYCVAKYETNPKIKPIEEDNQEEGGLEDLLNLLEQENDAENEEENERKKILIKKEKPSQTQPTQSNESIAKSPETNKSKSSITITKITKETVSSNLENIITEKNTGARIVKSTFKNEIDLNMRLACDYGKFLKLSDIYRRMHELKESKDYKWYTIFLLLSKTESKCSAKGNNYVIWRLVDVNNIEKHQEISLFLFGNAYKSHWKSNEFEIFALIQPDILDSNNQNQNQNNNTNSKPANQTNSVFSNASPYNRKTSQATSWNKFAAKKVDLNNKLSLSVRAEHQLIPLGFSKDITMCQSFKNESTDTSKRCKNLVNLEDAPFCIFHCKQADSKNKFGVNTKGKYSMAQPTNRFGSSHLFESTAQSDIKFAPNPTNSIMRNQLAQKAADLENRVKISKELKAEVLNSLNSSIKDSSTIVSQIAVKTGKKSDLELLASLDGKQLDKDEIKKIRLAEQATVRHYSNTNTEAQKEIKKLFNSKVLLPNETTCNNSISSKRLHEFKQSQTQSLTGANAGAIKLSPFEYSTKLKEKYEDNKKNFTLSSMTSHKDIVKQIKEKDTNKPVVETKPVITSSSTVSTNKSIIAADFLAKRVNEIKNAKASQENKNTGFDLELYIGDSLTTKKLLDVNSKYISHSPATATSTGYKRKLDEIKGSPSSPNNAKAPNEIVEDKKAKKLKMIDEILSIKSNHLKEVNDPEKNPHVKAYFNKLEQQEMVDNKLCSVRNREIRAVTCKVCSYTAFSQSDYCKKQNHVVNRHMALQRYFKCKICSKRTYTLDKLCPVSACSQCGNEKFEPCTMKDEDISISKGTNDSLSLESEMLSEAT